MGEAKGESLKFNLATAVLGGAAWISKHFFMHKTEELGLQKVML